MVADVKTAETKRIKLTKNITPKRLLYSSPPSEKRNATKEELRLNTIMMLIMATYMKKNVIHQYAFTFTHHSLSSCHVYLNTDGLKI